MPGHAVTTPAVTVPPGQLYVMGDNRPISEDSRYIGTVPLSGVKGSVVAVFAPIHRVALRALRPFDAIVTRLSTV